MRTKVALPAFEVLQRLEDEFRSNARARFEEVYPNGDVARNGAGVRLSVLGDLHLVVGIEHADSQHLIGDDTLLATQSVLRDVDAAFGIDDLQGLPARYWFILGNG